MAWVALKMLTGDRSKFFGIVFGVMFASLLIAHQVSIFVGIMARTTSQIRDVREPDLWVMDEKVRYVEEVPALRPTDLQPRPQRSRRRLGGADAQEHGRARLSDGNFRQVVLMGIDDDTLVGAPTEMVLGDLADLRKPDAFLIDEAGYTYLWPGQPVELGKVLEMNDRRAVLVGVCKAGAPFVTLPIVYARYSQAIFFGPRERNMTTFVLVKAEPGSRLPELSERIYQQTGRKALTTEEFSGHTVDFYLKFTASRSTSASRWRWASSSAWPSRADVLPVHGREPEAIRGAEGDGREQPAPGRHDPLAGAGGGVLGYCLGIGLAALFFESTANVVALSGFKLHWQVMAGTAAAVLFIVMLASLLSIRKVLVLEAAIVFRG